MFSHVVCINLDRRPERWKQFQDAVPILGWLGIDRYSAVDSRLCRPPPWYSAICPQPGAWGCLRTHLRIWEDALSGDWPDVLVFEDDAIFCDAFADKFSQFMANVPDDWEQIYLGGQHLEVEDHPPEAVNDHVLRCHNVNRTHAYAMRPSMIQAASDTCALLPPGMPTRRSYHVDHRLGEMHKNHKVYAPRQWLVGQEHGVSDVLGGTKDYKQKWWNKFPVRELAEAVA